jgi:hypothetical protein
MRAWGAGTGWLAPLAETGRRARSSRGQAGSWSAVEGVRAPGIGAEGARFTQCAAQ